MKDHGEIGHLTKFDAFWMTRDQVLNFETWLKIHTNVSNLRHPPRPHELFFMILILLKMGKHSDFHLSFFQIVKVHDSRFIWFWGTLSQN